MNLPRLLAGLSLAAVLGAGSAVPAHYDHIFIIVDENKDLASVVGKGYAPAITALARSYGLATHYDAVAHPSEPNYVALVGGDTFGIHDDDGLPQNSVDAPHLGMQLSAASLSWKGYYQGLPAPGSLARFAGNYAFKHSGFLNFRSVRDDPHRAEHIVGFDRLESDAMANALPNFALIVPDLCDDMHGVGTNLSDCSVMNWRALIHRGDAAIARITGLLMKTTMWKSAEQCAIVLVFDEDDSGSTEGGGGRVPAVVITNHGPRGIVDATPYTHYSLLRTVEDAFRLPHLVHAGDPATRDMTPLFAHR